MFQPSAIGNAVYGKAQNMDMLDSTTKKLQSLAGTKMNKDAAEKVSKDFETLFLSQMLEQMFGESSGDSAFGNGETDEIYKRMMVQEYRKSIVTRGGIGIAGYIQRELLKTQEV